MKALPAFGALLTASVLLVPTVSQAARFNSVSVPFADLNLATDGGATILEKRITNAARTVCEIEDSRDLDLASATSACRDQAVAGAQPAFHAALLEARNPSVTVGSAAIAIVAQ
ncbi:MAG: UrcA family protein [Sphingomonas sp.]|nr:UrcA family protein [Sphingomonas sp.]